MANALATQLLEQRYLLRDHGGAVTETEADMYRRVACAVAAAEEPQGGSAGAWAERFFEVMAAGEFMPNSPTLVNAGRPGLQLSACFVLPLQDSLEHTLDTLKTACLIHKASGGAGYSFSSLRSAASRISSTNGAALGPVGTIRLFDRTFNALNPANPRFGGNMAVLDVSHPDIEDFIRLKQRDPIRNFNCSVAVTDEFMRHVQGGGEIDLIDPVEQTRIGRRDARALFELMVESAWTGGDPGLLFIDRIRKGTADPVPGFGPLAATNPCGEQPLYPYESCILGSINLAKVLSAGASPEWNWDKLGQLVDTGVRFLDDVIDVNSYVAPPIAVRTRALRRIGLGVMGWADALCRLGLPYDSPAAVSLAGKVMSFINERARVASEALAVDRGPFPAWNQSIYRNGSPIRNAARTTIAPTGTISILAGCSAGIEPLFALAFYRRHQLALKAQEDALDVNPIFLEASVREGVYREGLLSEVLEKGLEGTGLPAWMCSVFKSAHDLPPAAHVAMQAAFQRHTDNAVSKTVNLEHSAPMSKVREVFVRAHESGCKGVTVFRDGCRESQVLSPARSCVVCS